MRKEQRLQINNLLAQLCNSRGEGIIFCAEEFHFGLEVRKPLLLTLTTLESGNPGDMLV